MIETLLYSYFMDIVIGGMPLSTYSASVDTVLQPKICRIKIRCIEVRFLSG